MPVFNYKAIDNSGKFIRGNLDATNLNDLEVRLEKMGLDLVSFKERKGGSDNLRRYRVKRLDLINFTFHLEQLTRSGVPILEGLADLRESEGKSNFRDIIAGVIEAIEGGRSFSQALELYPRVFDRVFVNLINVGERSGAMPEVLQDLTETLKWQDELFAKTKKVITYPAIIGSVVLLVVMVMMIFVVPEIIQSIISLGGEIPFQTQALMAVSGFVSNFWYVVLGAPFVLFFLTRYLYKSNQKVRFILDGYLLRMAPIGPVLQKIKISRFTRYFALMYGAGITVLDAIQLSRAVMDNAVLEDGVERVWTQISDGASISESFQNIGIFPPLVVRMIRVGETGGRMDEALKNVSYFYERDINESIDKMEPALQTGLMLVLGSIVLWLAMAVLGPIYDTISTIDLG